MTGKNKRSAFLKRAAGPLLLCAQFFSASFSAAEVKPVIGPDGLLALSDGAPLSSYQAGAELPARYRAAGGTCLSERLRGAPAVPCADKAEADITNMYMSARDIRKLKPTLRPLLTEEVAGLLSYTTDLFKRINGGLWRGRLPENASDLDLMMLLLSGVNRLPDHKGRVLRADFFLKSPSKEELEVRLASYRNRLNGPEPFVISGFWSSSLGTIAGGRSSDGKDTALILEIASLTGKNISAASAFGKEQEILFRPGTRFEVLDITGPQAVPRNKLNELGVQYAVKLREIPL